MNKKIISMLLLLFCALHKLAIRLFCTPYNVDPSHNFKTYGHNDIAIFENFLSKNIAIFYFI